MTTRLWAGANGTWYDAGQWITLAGGQPSYPLPGDDVRITAGTLLLDGNAAQDDGAFDDQTVALGGKDAAHPATLRARSAFFQIFFDITTEAGRYARIATQGTSGFDGSLTVRGHLTIDGGETSSPGGSATSFVLTPDALVSVEKGGTLKLDGSVVLETAQGQTRVDAGGTLVNDGTLTLLGGGLVLGSGAHLAGAGTLVLGTASTLRVGGAASETQILRFDGTGAVLKIGDLADFASPITHFAIGDRIDLTEVTADYAALDPATGLLDIRDGGASGREVATLRLDAASGSLFTTEADGAGGTEILLADSPTPLSANIGTADQALQSDVVRATLTTAEGTPIDGTGVKIGIVSDSFNATGTADAAGAEGYLPYDAATGTTTVTVLKDDAGGSDEGQAMAELVHAIAPGAEIYFCAAGNSPVSTAAAVKALAAAGCSVITDDIGFANEPYFQVTGSLDRAIEQAIAGGASYFTAASNLGNAFLQSAFDPMATTLQDAPSDSVEAQRFSNGTAYEPLTLVGGQSIAIDLQWDAPYPTAGADAADALVMKLYDSKGRLVATSHQLKLAGSKIPEVELDLHTRSATLLSAYELSITHVDGTPAVSEFSVILTGTGDGSGPGGYFDDPAAAIGAGTTSGHDLVPGANTVGAVDWANAPFFGTRPFAEGYSSSGPGALLFDQNGNRLPTPLAGGKVNFLAPDGVDTSTAGFQPFLGTSAAAPDAAAVGALMLQANPDLTPAQVTTLLAASADSLGLPAALQGTGVINALRAVTMARDLAAPDLSLDKPRLMLDAAHRTATVEVAGRSNAIGQTVTLSLDHWRTIVTTASVAADGTWSAAISADLAGGADALSSGRHRILAEVVGTGRSSAPAVGSFGVPEVEVRPGGGSRFVFAPAFGRSSIDGFSAAGPQHDQISLPSRDAARLGAVLAAATTNAAGDTILRFDAHEALTLVGVSSEVLRAHRQDFTFHA